MPLRQWLRGGRPNSQTTTQALPIFRSRWILLVSLAIWLPLANAMTPARIAELRKETVDMFYHGFDNYMDIAFPEDELRPVSCIPLTRDARNPRHVELNDVLGNYSLTLIDSLSTLAILASAPQDEAGTGAKALRDFQDGVASLIVQYGDGTSGPSGKGLRARGFDLDSKVQVFETVIRGVGGLLSAHLFAIGDLPMTGYSPRPKSTRTKDKSKDDQPTISWLNGFRYNGQLLRLALDLAERLLPAFYTATGMPYPRVNLRHGIPFYTNSPLHEGSHLGDFSDEDGPPEITETCSAGAGSLVLEFTTLSRLTGDSRFEELAKRSFWAVWNRRSNIGLIGAGVDAENGQWIGPYAGIGAGTDSFFEYAFKTHVLLSGHRTPNTTEQRQQHQDSRLDPNTIYNPLSEEENSPEAFLAVWHEAHAAIRRHLYSPTHHPHYVNAHLVTGSPQAFWIDSLGAYYPGLLTLAGEVEEAIETNLLYTALWTRYAALPERWSVRDGHVEGGLGWWPGRPEFIESNYHLYRATRDPWYLHVGEMVLKDIKRRCWTKCGWSGLQDVRTGEKSDRMESFFLGETAKYLYLLFDPDHPLNDLDAPYVFTTEGHPVLLPRDKANPPLTSRKSATTKAVEPHSGDMLRDTCPAPPPPVPFTISSTAARTDVFHASSLIGLHMIPNHHHATIEGENIQVNNHTYFPWTLPTSMMPINGTCDRLPLTTTFTIEFPNNNPLHSASVLNGFNMVLGPQGLVRTNDGILVKTLSGLKMGMVHESSLTSYGGADRRLSDSWRVGTIANMPLGRDEQIFIPRDVIGDLTDPSFTRIRDPVMLDIVVQLEHVFDQNQNMSGSVEDFMDEEEIYEEDSPSISIDTNAIMSKVGLAAEYRTMLSSLLHQVTSALRDPSATLLPQPETLPTYTYATIPAVLPTGKGAHLLINAPEAPDLNTAKTNSATLSFTTLYFAGHACTGKLPDESVRHHHIIVMKRGGCTFSEKLSNIPSYTPTSKGLKLVIMVSEDGDGEDAIEDEERSLKGESRLIRPLLDEPQLTPSGLLRHHQISMVMIGGGDEAVEVLRRAKSIGIRRRYHVESQGLVVGNIFVI